MSDIVQPFDDIPPWPPVRWTPPLTEDFPSAFDGYRDLLRVVWLAAFGYVLEVWQETTLRHIFELYPEGHRRAGKLRWRRVVISLARQNGKTEIAAAVGLIMLLMKNAPMIVGIATNTDQAQLIYKRTMAAIKGTPRLAAKFRALTETRGIRSLSGGEYQLKPAKSASLQGIPVDLALVDELHLVLRALWTDLVKGLGGRPNCLVVGITTAGDENSELLLSLYEQGEEAIAKGAEARMCFLLWEAPESRIPEDDETYGRFLAYANPSIASGRRDLDIEIEEARATPEPDQLRYSFNRFVKATATFIPAAEWARGNDGTAWPAGARPTFTITRTPDWKWASISAFTLLPDGSVYCDPVASVPIDDASAVRTLADIAQKLMRHNPVTFGMQWETLGDLGKELKNRGIPVRMIRSADMRNGSSLFFTKVMGRKVKHPGYGLLSYQIPRAVRKNLPDGGFRISVSDSKSDVDAVLGHIEGVYMVDTQIEPTMQIF
jgi:hypothetical protein